MVPNYDNDNAAIENRAGLDAITGYEDGDHYVIRDEENQDAWIRSDLVRTLGR